MYIGTRSYSSAASIHFSPRGKTVTLTGKQLLIIAAIGLFVLLAFAYLMPERKSRAKKIIIRPNKETRLAFIPNHSSKREAGQVMKR